MTATLGSGWDGRGWGGMLTFICTCTRGDRYAWIRVGWDGVRWDVDVDLHFARIRVGWQEVGWDVDVYMCIMI